MIKQETMYRSKIAAILLVFSLMASSLACSLQMQNADEGLRQTDVALAIQQTRVGETATAMVLQASWTPVPPTAEPPTPEPPTVEPIIPTDTPIQVQPVQPTAVPVVATQAPVASSDQSAVVISDWKMSSFTKLSNGCRENPELNCWLSKMSGSGSWKTGNPTSSALTARTPIIIDPSWPNPYLVFDHDLSTQGFTGYLEVKFDTDWLLMRKYEASTTGWRTEAIPLKDYAGKEITPRLTGSLTSFLRTSIMSLEWYIQNIRVEPNYVPED